LRKRALSSQDTQLAKKLQLWSAIDPAESTIIYYIYSRINPVAPTFVSYASPTKAVLSNTKVETTQSKNPLHSNNGEDLMPSEVASVAGVELSLKSGGELDANLTGSFSRDRAMSTHNRLIAPTPQPMDDNEYEVVEFSSVEYLTLEGSSDVVTMQICRRGQTGRALDVHWKTDNVNIEPDYYIEQEGTVTLKPGESDVDIDVHVMDNPMWNVEAIMSVTLKLNSEAPSSGTTTLGDLKTARIVILNDDAFPMDRDPEGKFNTISVILGFVEHNYLQFKADVHWGLVYKLAPGLCFIIGQLVTMYLLRTVTYGYAKYDNNKDSIMENYTAYLIACSVGYLANFFLGWYADVCFMRLKLGGKATRALRTAAMDIVTQLTPRCEEEFDTGELRAF
jgi:hypothetical protein